MRHACIKIVNLHMPATHSPTLLLQEVLAGAPPRNGNLDLPYGRWAASTPELLAVDPQSALDLALDVSTHSGSSVSSGSSSSSGSGITGRRISTSDSSLSRRR